MCLTITPRYGCGHKDQAWLLYCNPTRKICGRKHPPLEVCHGKDVQKQDWNVFEPRCPRCERRFRAGRDKQLKRMTRISSAPPLGPSSTSTTPTMPPLTATATVPAVPPASKRRRAGSIFDGLKDLLRIDSALSLNSNSSSSRSARRAAACAAATLAATAHDSASLADSDKASSDDADSLQMLELHRALPSVSVDGETGFARGLLLDGAWSSSSLDSLPCSPRTSMAPTPVVQD